MLSQDDDRDLGALDMVLYWLALLGCGIWVYLDAGDLGVQKGRLGGGQLDMSRGFWVASVLLLWIIALPCYLVARGRYQDLTRQRTQTPAFTPATAAAPPQYSVDGQWWWDGTQWVPTGR